MPLAPGETPLDHLRRIASHYAMLAPPPAPQHDWPARAKRTLADLIQAPAATAMEYGDRYVMPYPNGQYPDSMVQIALITTLSTYAEARGRRIPLVEELRRGLERFYDPAVGTLRRYLPSVGAEKDYDAVDSWYLYHPMSNLARLALRGDDQARSLLLRSADYGIRAARHFEYAWPIIYDIRDFRVITQQIDAGRPGETDAGGLYAYLMLQLHELTGDTAYVAEAENALDAADGHGLDLMYQLNLTAWGAVACLRMWRITHDRAWIDRSYYWLVNLLAPCALVESREGAAVHYPTFMAATCMYNSDYFAPLEDYECWQALGEYLALGGAELDPAARLLAEEFRRYAVHRCGFYYPDMLPAEILAAEQEAGIIDRSLSFPIEDLYPDGRLAGQVGQEIYGAGMAFLFAADALASA